MKRISNFFILVISLILGCSCLVACTLGVLHKSNLSNTDKDTTNVGEDLGDLITEPLSPMVQHQIKFNPYNFLIEDDSDLSILQIYSEKQTEKFMGMRKNGERQTLSLDEILFLMNDSQRIYYQYDKVVLTNAYKYGFFASNKDSPDSMTITPYHEDFTTLSTEEASKKRADAVKDIYKIFFYRCYMYDTWLLKATEAYWSSSGIYHDWGNFRIDGIEHEDYKYKPWGTMTTYMKFLYGEEFNSLKTYQNKLEEISWDRFFKDFTLKSEQPFLLFVNYGILVYYPDKEAEQYLIGDLVSSTEEIDNHIAKNNYKYYYDGYVIVRPDQTNTSSNKYLNSITQYNIFFGLSRPLFSETIVKQ